MRRRGQAAGSNCASMPGSSTSRPEPELLIDREGDLEVSNVHGSSADRGNWKAKWEKAAGRRQWSSKCQIYNCGNSAQLGGHMYVKGLRRQFILPICHGCNRDPRFQYGKGWAHVKLNAALMECRTHPNTCEYN